MGYRKLRDNVGALYLRCNGYLETIYPEEDGSFSYEDLGHFTEATRLYMAYCDLTDFSFLKGCPEICMMELLYGEWKGKEPVIPDPELLPNARFLDFYEENYRFEP